MEPQNILVTGAAGFIGGSIVADFMDGIVPGLPKESMIAAVRSEEQKEALSKAGINVIRLDLSDSEAIEKVLVHQQVSIVIHTAGSLDPTPALNLIGALSKRREATGEQTYFIHTGATSAFMERSGWPAGPFHDNGSNIFDLEKKYADTYAARKTDVAIIETAEEKSVKVFLVMPGVTHGKGTGVWNRLSVVIPTAVKASLDHKEVRQFADNLASPYGHISDLTALFGKIVEKIIHGEEPPSGRNGYYFGMSCRIKSHTFYQRLAETLYARGLVTSPSAEIWSDNDAAAEALNIPAMFVEYLWNSTDEVVSHSGDRVGWKPKWNEERVLNSLDDEIDSVLELGEAKSSLKDSLRAVAKQFS